MVRPAGPSQKTSSSRVHGAPGVRPARREEAIRKRARRGAENGRNALVSPYTTIPRFQPIR